MITRPMLASECKNVDELEWPMIATPKVDGIRCLNPDGRILSRSFKPIPNDFIRKTLVGILPVGADGELFSGDNFQKVTSAVMSQDGEPDFVFWMFDFVPGGLLDMPYVDRLRAMVDWWKVQIPFVQKYVRILPFKVINSVEELRAYEKEMLAKGFEGVILRHPYGPYKCGRGSWKERYLLKLKPFKDSEAVIIGFEEQLSNQNKLEKNEFGLAKRSGAKAGKVPMGRLGKFKVKDEYTGKEFSIGTGQGLTLDLRKKIWDNRKEYLGEIIKYKFQDYGVKDKPRCPVMLGFRDRRDM